ncbi:sensor histidine kinase [Flectobacillus sp. BAB-3569]|uniref:sensor histidine kinase n=1 Tax=Flectobacillus sp. BAB-3569 TaxID=1509483 RepID=UPI000BA3A544|nr:histidine kinase [Flectobacillus sp. BAB-3569]PAC26093.1 histidine kinase [Flectobacillus sp. BAB-3569]
MAQIGESFVSNTWKRVLIVMSAFFLLYAITYILDPFSPSVKMFFHRSIGEILLDLGTTLIFCIGVSETSIYIGKRLNKVLSWTESPVRRLLAEASLNLFAVFSIHLLIALLYIFITNHDQKELVLNFSLEDTRWFVVSTMIVGVIVTINTGNYMINNWKNEAIRATELKQIIIETELQSLKFQLDPHFVFNNLSVLSELILQDQQLGYDYAENFSKIYRYLLVNSKKNTISLEEELKFLDAYIFLLELRIGQGVDFDIDISPSERYLKLPPLTLQMLVENALKHNKTLRNDPLKIRIYSAHKNLIIVENTMSPLELNIPSSGIGLKNIERRYNILKGGKPIVYQDEKIFRVTIPLIK